MRIFFFVLGLLTTSTALSNQAIYGLIGRDSSGLHLKTNSDSTCIQYNIETKNDDAAAFVRKLSNGDSITASGVFETTSCKVRIESIDYVGLKKLLGKWYSHEGILSVHNFNSLSYYPINEKNLLREHPFIGIPRIEYRYSVTPTEGKEWVLFLSDHTSTIFATIQFDKGSAIMKFYDSENGDLTKVLYLSRWGNLR